MAVQNVMCKFLFVLLIYVFVFNNGDCSLRRNSFQGRLRTCKTLCGFRGASWSGSSIQTCLLLQNQNNITVSECVAGCLERKGESLTNAIECQCRFGNCIQSSTTTTSSTTSSTTSTTTPAPVGR